MIKFVQNLRKQHRCTKKDCKHEYCIDVSGTHLLLSQDHFANWAAAYVYDLSSSFDCVSRETHFL
jgi:hypothetical protein